MSLHGSEKLMGTARGDRRVLTFFSRLLSSKIELRRSVPWILGDGTSLWVVTHFQHPGFAVPAVGSVQKRLDPEPPPGLCPARFKTLGLGQWG